jgi:hypothetical protein
MYPTSGQLILGFHGCDRKVKDNVLSRKIRLRPSKNRWDWLGHGIFFWESDPKRAIEYAKIVATRPQSKIKHPSVIGAVLDLGNCLNLLNRDHLIVLKRSYAGLAEAMMLKGQPMPVNKNVAANKDLLLRDLDCAVINYLHEAKKVQGRPPFDSVRAVFWEGRDLYPGAGFRELNHIQICIRNPNCIKGYFDPLKPVLSWPQI